MAPSSDVSQLLARLRTPEAADRLVERWITDALGRPVGELLPPTRIAEWAARLLRAGSASDALHARVVADLQEGIGALAKQSEKLRDRVPSEWATATHSLAGHPYSLDRKMLLTVLDREPMRKLIRALLVDVLIEFGRKVAALATPLTGGRVGRGLGALGALAGAVGSGVVGAVSGELERQVEKRAAEFADMGISRVLQRLADLICDPSLAGDQSELRVALIDGVLELALRDLAAEARKQDPAASAAVVRRALQTWAARPELPGELAKSVEQRLAKDLARPAGEVLTELGLRQEVEGILHEILQPRARAFDWAAWIEAELAPPSP